MFICLCFYDCMELIRMLIEISMMVLYVPYNIHGISIEIPYIYIAIL